MRIFKVFVFPKFKAWYIQLSATVTKYVEKIRKARMITSMGEGAYVSLTRNWYVCTKSGSSGGYVISGRLCSNFFGNTHVSKKFALGSGRGWWGYMCITLNLSGAYIVQTPGEPFFDTCIEREVLLGAKIDTWKWVRRKNMIFFSSPLLFVSLLRTTMHGPGSMGPFCKLLCVPKSEYYTVHTEHMYHTISYEPAHKKPFRFRRFSHGPLRIRLTYMRE